MSDQCQHCTVRGDWDKCQSTKCSTHEDWAWLQLKDQRNELADTVELLSEQLQEAQGFSAMKSINIDELQARIDDLKSLIGSQWDGRRVDGNGLDVPEPPPTADITLKEAED